MISGTHMNTSSYSISTQSHQFICFRHALWRLLPFKSVQHVSILVVSHTHTMIKPPNKGHLRITDKNSCTNLSIIKRFHSIYTSCNYISYGLIIRLHRNVWRSNFKHVLIWTIITIVWIMWPVSLRVWVMWPVLFEQREKLKIASYYVAKHEEQC